MAHDVMMARLADATPSGHQRWQPRSGTTLLQLTGAFVFGGGDDQRTALRVDKVSFGGLRLTGGDPPRRPR